MIGSLMGSSDYWEWPVASKIGATKLFPALLIDRFDHIGHGLEFFLAGQNAIDGLTGLALGVADREQCGVRVANHVGTGVLGLAIAAGVPGAGVDRVGADDQGKLPHLAAQLGNDAFGHGLADARVGRQ